MNRAAGGRIRGLGASATFVVCLPSTDTAPRGARHTLKAVYGRAWGVEGRESGGPKEAMRPVDRMPDVMAARRRPELPSRVAVVAATSAIELLSAGRFLLLHQPALADRALHVARLLAVPAAVLELDRRIARLALALDHGDAVVAAEPWAF
jgi:hypothetical protein